MAKRGPKPIDIDWAQFEKLCAIHCTLREIAQWFRCSEDTIERAVMRQYDAKFADVYQQKRSVGMASLRRLQYQAAEKGNTAMLIWLGKQWLGQKDRQHTEVSGPDGDAVTMRHVKAEDLTDDQLAAIAAKGK